MINAYILRLVIFKPTGTKLIQEHQEMISE